ncbi:MAG TPA: hypothetical protein VNG32_04665 [Candidatus Dormibacteraeota bacterium]|nr:hypothetical protein [Candidatus Dormibacteraeota bacterium]
MKTLTVAKLKSQFSTVVSDLRQGQEIVITYGRNKEPLATIVPQSKMQKPNYAVQLGDLKQQGWTYTLRDFTISDNELLGS